MFSFFLHLILSSKKKLSENTRRKVTSCDARAMSNWASISGQTPRSKEAGCGLTFPASDLPLLYPCLSSCPPCLSLPLVAEPGRRIYSLVLRRPLHHGHILLLGFFLGEDQFCFSMHFISLVHRRKQRLPFIETLPRQKHAIQSSLHHFGAISPPQIVLWFWRGG